MNIKFQTIITIVLVAAVATGFGCAKSAGDEASLPNAEAPAPSPLPAPTPSPAGPGSINMKYGTAVVTSNGWNAQMDNTDAVSNVVTSNGWTVEVKYE